MNYKLLTGPDKIDRSKWNDFITGHPEGTVFQSPEMYDLYTKVYNYSPLVLALEDERGKLAAILLAVIIKDYKGIGGVITARCVVYGGSLISADAANAPELTDELIDALVEAVKSRSLYIQFRNFRDVSVSLSVFRKHDFKFLDHLNLIVNTSNADITLSGISKSKIRQAKRSLFAGAELARAESTEEIQGFYRILKKVYKNKVRKPLPPESFFLSFFNETKQGRLGLVMIAKYKGVVIGGMVCPITPGKSLSEWYVCGLDKLHHDIHPSIILTYGAIEYAVKNNIPHFDFMGIGSPDRPYGVRDFKIGFGCEIVNYGRFERINKPLLYQIARAGFSLLSFLRLV